MTRESIERLGLFGLRLTLGDERVGEIARETDYVDARFVQDHSAQLTSIYQVTND